MFVFAISIAILQHLAGSMGLVTSDAEGDAHVSELHGDIVINCIDFLIVGPRTLGYFSLPGTNLWGNRCLLLLKRAPPAAHLFPGLESADLHVVRWSFRIVFPFLMLAVGSLPCVN